MSMPMYVTSLSAGLMAKPPVQVPASNSCPATSGAVTTSGLKSVTGLPGGTIW